MSMNIHESTVNKLQALVSEWNNLFETKAPLDIQFHLISNNMLAMNGILLCPASDVDADSATFDVEFFFIPTISGSEYEIYLDCPNEGPSKIGYIKHIITVYSAGSEAC